MRFWQASGLCLLFGVAAWAGEPPALPALAEAAATNTFAEYTHANFDLVMDRRMGLTIFPKDAEQRKGPPILIGAPWFTLYGVRNQSDYPPVITEFITVPPAKKQPDELNIVGKLSNTALFGVKYKFRANSLQLSCWIRNPPGQEQATPMQFEIDFDATHYFAPNIEMAERKKRMAGWYIKTREKGTDDKSFKAYTHMYWDVVHFKKEAQFLENFGPWGARKIRLSTTASGAGYLHADKRGTQMYPYTGFKCFLQVPAVPKKKTDSTTLTITIE